MIRPISYTKQICHFSRKYMQSLIKSKHLQNTVFKCWKFTFFWLPMVVPSQTAVHFFFVNKHIGFMVNNLGFSVNGTDTSQKRTYSKSIAILISFNDVSQNLNLDAHFSLCFISTKV